MAWVRLMATSDAAGVRRSDAQAAVAGAAHRFCSQDLINSLFTHPYTKIELGQQGLGVSRLTATKYLDTLARDGFLRKLKFGRTNDYMNAAPRNILVVPSEGSQ